MVLMVLLLLMTFRKRIFHIQINMRPDCCIQGEVKSGTQQRPITWMTKQIQTSSESQNKCLYEMVSHRSTLMPVLWTSCVTVRQSLQWSTVGSREGPEGSTIRPLSGLGGMFNRDGQKPKKSHLWCFLPSTGQKLIVRSRWVVMKFSVSILMIIN